MSTSKYGPTRHNPGHSYGPRWKWVHDDGKPWMTDHVLERWDQRTPIDFPSPEYAYDHAVDVSDMRFAYQDRNGQIPSEVWYYYSEEHDFGISLLVSDDVCKTVYLEEYLSAEAQAMLKGVRELVE